MKLLKELGRGESSKRRKDTKEEKKAVDRLYIKQMRLKCVHKGSLWPISCL